MNTRWPEFDVFDVTQAPAPKEAPRSIHTLEGMGDRMRTAAFAEIQARDAFLWAADRFEDAPEALRTGWRKLALDEQRHLDSILTRMKELGLDVRERKVTNQLWISLSACQTARDFSVYIANAEERGRRAGIRFYETLRERDPVTSEIFRVIAEEEIAHIQLARDSFPDAGLSPGGIRK